MYSKGSGFAVGVHILSRLKILFYAVDFFYFFQIGVIDIDSLKKGLLFREKLDGHKSIANRTEVSGTTAGKCFFFLINSPSREKKETLAWLLTIIRLPLKYIQ